MVNKVEQRLLNSMFLTSFLNFAKAHVSLRLWNSVPRTLKYSIHTIATTVDSHSPNQETASTDIVDSDVWLNWSYGNAFTSQPESARKAIDPLWKGILTDSEVLVGIQALKPFCTAEKLNRFDTVINKRTDKVRFVFENPTNVNNVWAALRSLDSFGIQFADIILPDIDRPESSFAQKKRSTMNTAVGSQQWLTLYEHSNTTTCLTSLRNQGYKLFATDLTAKSKLLRHLVRDLQSEERINKTASSPQRIAIVMGNEEQGISQETRQVVDGCFYIPMHGFAESLNLSIATAVICSALESSLPLLQESVSVRSMEMEHSNVSEKKVPTAESDLPHNDSWQMEEDRGLLAPHLDPLLRDRIILTWLSRSVRGSMAILRRAGLPVEGNSRFNTIGRISTKP